MYGAQGTFETLEMRVYSKSIVELETERQEESNGKRKRQSAEERVRKESPIPQGNSEKKGGMR